MELLLEIIVELLFEGGFEGAESDSTPMGLRIVLAITIILGIFFAYVLGRMWFRIVKRLRKR